MPVQIPAKRVMVSQPVPAVSKERKAVDIPTPRIAWTSARMSGRSRLVEQRLELTRAQKRLEASWIKERTRRVNAILRTTSGADSITAHLLETV